MVYELDHFLFRFATKYFAWGKEELMYIQYTENRNIFDFKMLMHDLQSMQNSYVRFKSDHICL